MTVGGKIMWDVKKNKQMLERERKERRAVITGMIMMIVGIVIITASLIINVYLALIVLVCWILVLVWLNNKFFKN